MAAKLSGQLRETICKFHDSILTGREYVQRVEKESRYIRFRATTRDAFPSPLTRRAREVRRGKSGRVVRRRPFFGRLV
jgi:hypothetical protein